MRSSGNRRRLPGLMTASTCCFMVAAGAALLPFGPQHTFYHCFSVSSHLILFNVPLGSLFLFHRFFFLQLLIVRLELFLNSPQIVSLPLSLSASSVDHCPDVLFMVCSHKLLISGGRPACAPRRQKWGISGWRAQEAHDVPRLQDTGAICHPAA